MSLRSSTPIQSPFQPASHVSMLSPIGDSKRVSTQPADASAAKAMSMRSSFMVAPSVIGFDV